MEKKSQHVIRNLMGGWSVVRSGALRSSRNFTSEKDAIEYGRIAAKREGAALYIHRSNGTVREKQDYSDSKFAFGG